MLQIIYTSPGGNLQDIFWRELPEPFELVFVGSIIPQVTKRFWSYKESREVPFIDFLISLYYFL